MEAVSERGEGRVPRSLRPKGGREGRVKVPGFLPFEDAQERKRKRGEKGEAKRGMGWG